MNMSPKYRSGNSNGFICCLVSLMNLSQGPLVSTKQSSQAISAEYANADPTYAAKTAVCCASARLHFPMKLTAL